MKKQTLYIFLISIMLMIRIVYYYAQPDIYSDNLAQIATAQNFMEGHGFSFKYLDSQKEFYYKTDIQYPPLYSFLLALITFITSNPLLSSFIIQIAVLLLLTIVWKKIFNLLKAIVFEEAYIYFISMLIMSTSIFNIINTILFVSLLLLSLSIYFIFAYLFLDKSKKLNLFLSTFFASLLFWTHYSYFLVAFYPAVVLFIIYHISKNKSILFGVFSSFIISLIVTSGLLVYNYITTGFINYMRNPDIWEAGFFPEHLLSTDPFFLNTFIKSSYIYYYIFNTDQNIILAVLFQIISIIIFIAISVLFFKLRKNKSLTFQKTSLLFIPFIVIIALTILFLLYPTLRYHEIPLFSWTHIGEPRYLSAVYLSIITIVIMLVFVKVDYLNKKIVKIFKAAMICLILVSSSINIYSAVEDWDYYDYKTNHYNRKHDHGELVINMRIELSRGNIPVFIVNDLIDDSFRMSQLVKAAVIKASEVIKFEHFPSNMVFFLTLPEEKYYRNIDYQLLEWGKKFNLKQIGTVRTSILLFKVNGL